MFWFWALLSPFGYALQEVLLSKIVRNLDGPSVAFYRGIALSIAFLPLVFFLEPDPEWSSILAHLDFIVIASILGTIALLIRYYCIRHIPVGMVQAIRTGSQSVFSVVAGWWFFQEYIPLWGLVSIGTIIGGVIWIKLQKVDFQHLPKANYSFVYGLVLLDAILLTGALVVLVMTYRSVSPVIAGYLWEIGITICAGIFLLIRKFFTHKNPVLIDKKKYWEIFWRSSPAVLGTAGFALATQIGPMGVVIAVAGCGIIFTGLMMRVFYGESLTPKQWSAMGIILIGVIGLRLVTG